MNQEERGRYMASPEWYRKRGEVLDRSRGKCERVIRDDQGEDLRCDGSAEYVHHLTYERVGAERLGDLLGICAECHAFIHAHRKTDPIRERMDLLKRIRERDLEDEAEQQAKKLFVAICRDVAYCMMCNPSSELRGLIARRTERWARWWDSRGSDRQLLLSEIQAITDKIQEIIETAAKVRA